MDIFTARLHMSSVSISIVTWIIILASEITGIECAFGASSDVYWGAFPAMPRRPTSYASNPQQAFDMSCSFLTYGIYAGVNKACEIEIFTKDYATAGCLANTGICSKTNPVTYLRITVQGFSKYCQSGFFNKITKKCELPYEDQPNRGIPQCPSPLEANPIHTSTGNKIQKETDFQSRTPFPLRIVRTYNSYDRDGQHTTFGYGWRGNYFSRIFKINTSSLYRYKADGSLHYWYLSGSEYVSDTEPGSKVVYNSDGWVHTDQSGFVHKYDLNGYVTEITNSEGLTHQIIYSDIGMISQVVDDFNNALTYEYNSSLFVSAINTPDGATYHYEYDDIGNLIKVIFPDETPDDLSNNPVKTYHYEDVTYKHYLTGITNENGIRYATWSYDELGRAVSSIHAGGAENFSFTYNADGSTEVNDPLNNTRIYNFVSPTGLDRIESVSGGLCPSCGLTAKAYTYDSNGLVIQKTDQNDNHTSYSRDSEGRVIERIDGVNTSVARTIATEWHPDFQKPVRITEPSRITEFTYDSAGRLLSKTERTNP